MKILSYWVVKYFNRDQRYLRFTMHIFQLYLLNVFVRVLSGITLSGTTNLRPKNENMLIKNQL